jgi:hypothetical protein
VHRPINHHTLSLPRSKFDTPFTARELKFLANTETAIASINAIAPSSCAAATLGEAARPLLPCVGIGNDPYTAEGAAKHCSPSGKRTHGCCSPICRQGLLQV